MKNSSNDSNFLPSHKYIHKFSGSDFPTPNERNLACARFIDSMNAHKRFDFSSTVSYIVFLLYFPIGVVLALLKLLVILPLSGILVTITPTCFHTFLTRYVICLLYGVWIEIKGKPDVVNARIWAANHLSEVDALAIRACGNPYILGYSFYLQLWWLKLSPLRLLNMVYVPQKSRSEGNSAQRDEIRNQVRNIIENKTNPILVFPEGGLTNGKAGLLQYHKFMFSLNVGVQPVVLRHRRPLPININSEAKGTTFFDNVFWFCFVPFQIYTVEFLPVMHIDLENNEDDLTFSRRVACTTAANCSKRNSRSTSGDDECKVIATPFLYRDKRNWLKTKHSLEGRGIKNISIIVDEENKVTYVNNLKSNRRGKKVLPESSKNDDKVKRELLLEMKKHWGLDKEDFDHLIMLGTSNGNGKPGSALPEGGDNKQQLEESNKTANADTAAGKMVEKSMFVFDVKPLHVETNLEELASTLKGIKFDGLVTWGAEHQLIPVAFGLYKLRISVVVEDDKVSQTDIEDVINGDGRGGEIISSVDLHVESKVKLPWD